MVLKCLSTCRPTQAAKSQDIIHGRGNRVHVPCGGGKGDGSTTYKCTVCSHERNPGNRGQDTPKKDKDEKKEKKEKKKK